MDIINLNNAIELDFKNIISNKAKCDYYISQISEYIEKINTKYNTLIFNIKDNKNIEIPIYLGIDSLNFQNKLYTLKFENIKKFYNRVFNRIYGDYYKIHKLIKNYIISNTTIPLIDIVFTRYKDLEQDKSYNFDEIIKIQNTINQYIQSLYDIINKKNITIEPFINSNNAGYAVKYYIYEENTNISIYNNKCLLFINYLSTFNTYHNNYLLDLLLQCNFLITSIKKDLDFNIDNELINLDNYIDISNIHLNYAKRNDSQCIFNSDNKFINDNNDNNDESKITIATESAFNKDNENISIQKNKINYCNHQDMTLNISELTENDNKVFNCNIL